MRSCPMNTAFGHNNSRILLLDITKQLLLLDITKAEYSFWTYHKKAVFDSFFKNISNNVNPTHFFFTLQFSTKSGLPCRAPADHRVGVPEHSPVRTTSDCLGRQSEVQITLSPPAMQQLFTILMLTSQPRHITRAGTLPRSMGAACTTEPHRSRERCARRRRQQRRQSLARARPPWRRHADEGIAASAGRPSLHS